MTELIVFGGTSEGRVIAEALESGRKSALVCTATAYGESLIAPGQYIRVHAGRLGGMGMRSLFDEHRPRLVIDATHPYATVVSENLVAVCGDMGIRYLRVVRDMGEDGGLTFPDLGALIAWLNERDGVVFSTLGAKEAPALTAVRGFADRVWLRILPDPAGLSNCIAAGFPAKRIICMQGPFSAPLNAAMFRATGANILITKQSGAAGGFHEKIEAARECGMMVATLARPSEAGGVSLGTLLRLIEEDNL